MNDSQSTQEKQMNEPARCELCGEVMPPGEEMFKFHGYSGPCPKPPVGPEDCLYQNALEAEFVRVMNNNVVARRGYDTAKKLGMDEMVRLKAAIVVLSNAHDTLMGRAGS